MPVDRKEMKADVERKLQFFGVIQAFSQGKLPDNKQIDSALASAPDHVPFPQDKLSPSGKKLISDVQDVIETLRAMVKRNNSDEIIQNMLYESWAGDYSPEGPRLDVTSKEAKNDGAKAYEAARTLATLFVTNSEVRKLVSDLGIVGRNLFATAAAEVRPTQEELEHAATPGQADQWHSASATGSGGGTGTVGHDQTPTVNVAGKNYDPHDDPAERFERSDFTQPAAQAGQAGVQQAGAQLAQAGHPRAGAQVQQTGQQLHAGVQEAGQQLAEAGHPTAGAHLQETGGELRQAAAQQQAGVPQAGAPQAGVQLAGRQQLGSVGREQYDHRIGGARRGQGRRAYSDDYEDDDNDNDDDDDDDVERAARRTRLRAQRVLDEAFPEELRQKFIWRLKRVLINIQTHKDYQDAMSFFLSSADKYGGHAQEAVAHGGRQAQATVDGDTPVSQLLTVLERFANGTSLRGVRAAADQLYTDANNDPELRQWWSAVNDYVRRVLLDEGYILDDECDREGRALEERGRYFYQDKYRSHWDAMWSELSGWLKQFDEDPLNSRLGEDFRRLTHDLFFDADGNFKFKPELWEDIKTIIAPAIIRRTGYIPIPRAEYSDDKLDLVIDNLVLAGPNLFPNVIDYEGNHRFKWSPFDTAGDSSRHRMTITLSQMQADLRDVRFAFRKKSGFPKLSDHGFADVVLARRGITVTVELETPRHKGSVFRVRNVNTHVDQLSFQIRGSKHDLLYKFIKGAATRAIKKAIANAVEKAITEGLETADDFLVDVRRTVEETRGREDVNTKEELAKLFQRKQQEVEAEAADKKDAAQAAAAERNSKFAIVTSPDKEILPDLNAGEAGKGSTTNEFIETQKLASSGRAWHSPAFSIA